MWTAVADIFFVCYDCLIDSVGCNVRPTWFKMIIATIHETILLWQFFFIAKGNKVSLILTFWEVFPWRTTTYLFSFKHDLAACVNNRNSMIYGMFLSWNAFVVFLKSWFSQNQEVWGLLNGGNCSCVFMNMTVIVVLYLQENVRNIVPNYSYLWFIIMLCG